MKVGFTGTQQGMRTKQRWQVQDLMVEFQATEFHHGDCIGADAEAHNIALLLHIPVYLHPPDNPSKRAFCLIVAKTYEPRPYLTRNREIVDCSDVLIAAPKGMDEELRSGTWATIRYARKISKPVRIVYPNGLIGVE